MRASAVTIKNVALRAGVTQQTVSNIGTKCPVVSPETRDRVERAVAARSRGPLSGRLFPPDGQSGSGCSAQMVLPRSPYRVPQFWVSWAMR
ncbi:LacI family DNA-binding transcriptional regulator [Streptomyces sp. NPDC096132]|uniref:LacI family DNA-binding transcriptional regulator n=1 Tax=Streptomyces sp. NPDC096132 TaxID=3366075 RepID=UPI00381ADE3C